MHPKLFTIPFTSLTVKSYGLMIVIGFLAAVSLIRRLSRDINPDRQIVTNGALYALIAGVVGARIFYVVHYSEKFRGDFFSVFAIWNGGLELLGGAILAMTVILLFLRYHKLPIRRYLDILAIALLLALSIGRIGCFFKGCCFGQPTDVAWGIRFPYASDAYYSQVYANPERNRMEPQLDLPAEFFGYYGKDGAWYQGLKPEKLLRAEQKAMVGKGGAYRCLAVHPTQLYSSGMALLCCFILYFFRRYCVDYSGEKKGGGFFFKPGHVFSFMLILYGIARFFIEFLRDDNPFEFDGITISQNISIGMVVLGVVLSGVFSLMKRGDAVIKKSW